MALLAGNAVIAKPSSLTPITALKMHEYFMKAGFDPDLIQILTGPGKLTFGDDQEREGQLCQLYRFHFGRDQGLGNWGRMLVPCTMELGGKAPAIMSFQDADLENCGPFRGLGRVALIVDKSVRRLSGFM